MESKGRRALWWVFVVVVATSLVAVSPGAATPAEATGDATFQVDGQSQTEPRPQLDHESDLASADEVHVAIFLHENGTATFTVDYRFENASSDDWESLRTDVEENASSYAESEAEDWNQVLETGQNQTNREMSLSNVSVATQESPAPRNMGHVTYTFQWTAFSHVEPALIEAGDALAGFALVDDTTLQFSWPEEYTVRDVSPSPDTPPDDSVLWNGDETEFTDDQPSIALIENGGTAIGPTESSDDQPASWTVTVAALGALALAAAIGWWASRRGSRGSGPAVGDAATDSASNGAATPPHASRTATEADADGAATVSSSEPNLGGATVGEQATETQPSSPPPELLSNEERVMALLERRGGRIKQQEVVTELEWTEAKTSQVVTSLREDDEIDVFRVGRENVLALPEDED